MENLEKSWKSRIRPGIIRKFCQCALLNIQRSRSFRVVLFIFLQSIPILYAWRSHGISFSKCCGPPCFETYVFQNELEVPGRSLPRSLRGASSTSTVLYVAAAQVVYCTVHQLRRWFTTGSQATATRNGEQARIVRVCWCQRVLLPPPLTLLTLRQEYRRHDTLGHKVPLVIEP